MRAPGLHAQSLQLLGRHLSRHRGRSFTEIHDEAAHAALEDRHAVFLCLQEGDVAGPVVVLDAVAGDNGTGAVAAVLAMDEDGRCGRSDDGKDGLDVVVLGSAKALEGDICVGDAVVEGLLGFVFPGVVDHAQVDDGFDAEFLKVLHTQSVRLSTTIDEVTYFAEINDSVLGRDAARAGDAQIGEGTD